MTNDHESYKVRSPVPAVPYRCAAGFRRLGIRKGDRIALLGPDAVSLGGSELLWMRERTIAGRLAPLDLAVERAVQEALPALRQARPVELVHPARPEHLEPLCLPPARRVTNAGSPRTFLCTLINASHAIRC